MMIAISVAFVLAVGIALANFENRAVIMNKNWFPSLVYESGPSIFIVTDSYGLAGEDNCNFI